MDRYINRLIACGFPAHEAHTICIDFVRNYTVDDLEDFVRSAEDDGHVA